MSEECKKARNIVLIPTIIILAVLMFCSSCASTHNTCAAYASNETNKTTSN